MLKCKITSKRYGGGGGTSTQSTIPEWAVPYLKNVGNQAETLYGTGALGQVAGVNPLLQAAFGSGAAGIGEETTAALGTLGEQQGRLTEAAKTGGYDTSALKDKAILEAEKRTSDLGKQYGATGTLGSARQAVAQGAQDAATAAQFAEIDRAAEQQAFQNRMAAEGALGQATMARPGIASGAAQAFSQLGTQARGVEQEMADPAWQALQRYASTIYGNPARQQSVAQGGK